MQKKRKPEPTSPSPKDGWDVVNSDHLSPPSGDSPTDPPDRPEKGEKEVDLDHLPRDPSGGAGCNW